MVTVEDFFSITKEAEAFGFDPADVEFTLFVSDRNGLAHGNASCVHLRAEKAGTKSLSITRKFKLSELSLGSVCETCFEHAQDAYGDSWLAASNVASALHSDMQEIKAMRKLESPEERTWSSFSEFAGVASYLLMGAKHNSHFSLSNFRALFADHVYDSSVHWREFATTPESRARLARSAAKVLMPVHEELRDVLDTVMDYLPALETARQAVQSSTIEGVGIRDTNNATPIRVILDTVYPPLSRNARLIRAPYYVLVAHKVIKAMPTESPITDSMLEIAETFLEREEWSLKEVLQAASKI